MSGGEKRLGQAARAAGRRHFDRVLGPYFLLQPDSSPICEDFWDANEIVRGCGEDEEPFDQVSAAVAVLRKPPTVLIQPKGSSICFRLTMLMR
jgi:hypothetical protein